jgi:hypothetical protein
MTIAPSLAAINPNFETLNPKQIQIINNQNPKREPSTVNFLNNWIFDFSICFGFRASSFGFLDKVIAVGQCVNRILADKASPSVILSAAKNLFLRLIGDLSLRSG